MPFIFSTNFSHESSVFLTRFSQFWPKINKQNPDFFFLFQVVFMVQFSHTFRQSKLFFRFFILCFGLPPNSHYFHAILQLWREVPLRGLQRANATKSHEGRVSLVATPNQRIKTEKADFSSLKRLLSDANPYTSPAPAHFCTFLTFRLVYFWKCVFIKVWFLKSFL